MKDALSLTKNQQLVFNVLSETKKPLSAYSILDELRDEGFRAPLQVYRALEKLTETGLVHRLDSLNAFIACCHPECGSHEAIAFTICQTCGDVKEMSDSGLTEKLEEMAEKAFFKLQNSTIELRGVCENCIS